MRAEHRRRRRPEAASGGTNRDHRGRPAGPSGTRLRQRGTGGQVEVAGRRVKRARQLGSAPAARPASSALSGAQTQWRSSGQRKDDCQGEVPGRDHAQSHEQAGCNTSDRKAAQRAGNGSAAGPSAPCVPEAGETGRCAGGAPANAGSRPDRSAGRHSRGREGRPRRSPPTGQNRETRGADPGHQNHRAQEKKHRPAQRRAGNRAPSSRGQRGAEGQDGRPMPRSRGSADGARPDRRSERRGTGTPPPRSGEEAQGRRGGQQGSAKRHYRYGTGAAAARPGGLAGTRPGREAAGGKRRDARPRPRVTGRARHPGPAPTRSQPGPGRSGKKRGTQGRRPRGERRTEGRPTAGRKDHARGAGSGRTRQKSQVRAPSGPRVRTGRESDSRSRTTRGHEQRSRRPREEPGTTRRHRTEARSKALARRGRTWRTPEQPGQPKGMSGAEHQSSGRLREDGRAPGPT